MNINFKVKNAAPDLDEDGFAKGSRPLCPFCSRPWSAKMMDLFEQCSVSTGYYGDPEEIEGVIDITCGGCERTIYRKEVELPAYRVFR